MLAAPGGAATTYSERGRAVRHAIRVHLRDFLAILGLLVVARHDRRRDPLRAGAALPARGGLAEAHRGRAVRTPRPWSPGRGQTVRVAGVRDRQDRRRRASRTAWPWSSWTSTGATRTWCARTPPPCCGPKTALKDMFLEVDPGTRAACSPRAGASAWRATAPDVDPDEILAALDADTRPYLTLLVSGAGKGLRGPRRGPERDAAPARAAPPRPGPRHAATARRRQALQPARPQLLPAHGRARPPPRGPRAPRERVRRGVRRAGRRGRRTSPRPRRGCRERSSGRRDTLERGRRLRARAAADPGRAASRRSAGSTRPMPRCGPFLREHHPDPARSDPPVRARRPSVDGRPARRRPWTARRRLRT